MQIVEHRRNRRRLPFLIAVALIAIAGTWFALEYWHGDNSNQSTNTNQTSSTKDAKPVATTSQVNSNMLFMGNSFWGRYINDWSMASSLKTAYPFSRLNEFDRSKYDAWITGLECPVVPGVNISSAEMDSTLNFNCSPDYLSEAAKWFTVVTLANNHTDNQGVDGFTETQNQLDKNGIQYFGHYDPYQLSDICDVIAMPVTVTKSDNSTVKGKLPVAMCGYHGVFKIPPAESLALMQQYAKYMPVIAMPHMGTEYQPAPDQLKTAVYESMIDNGADMVLGDHPHWVQTTEAYKGHLIVYSMGNFMFDQQDTAEVTRSAAINVVMNITSKDDQQLDKWLTIGESCGKYHDDCLSQIEQASLTKLPATYKLGVVGTNDANKITKPATSEQTADILKRLNWANSMTKLDAPYSSL
jgi:poly-gamma-glutamate synthesis protein (capsule biosynthesis protein)